MSDTIGGLTNLIEALQIFKKYGDPTYPTHCHHDVLSVVIDPEQVSSEDMKRLDELGFVRDDDEEGFMSFHFGSC